MVEGSVGHMSAFMAQTGAIVVLGDAGEALGDSMYETHIYVRGTVAGLGADVIEKELRDFHRGGGGEPARGGRRDRRRRRRLPPLRLGAPASTTSSRQRLLSRVDHDRHARPRHGTTRPSARRCARATCTTAPRSRRSSAPRARASTTSAASARSGACRTSTTSCSWARPSRATRSRAIASAAAPTSWSVPGTREAAPPEDPGDHRRHELRRALRARPRRRSAAARARSARRPRPATAA